MQDKFYNKLEKLLKKEKSFLDQEGDLLKSAVIDSAYKIEPKLIELLLEDTEVKKKFFSEIKKHWVFDINEFVAYIQDKHFLNDSYTQYKNKIDLNIDGKFLNERKEVSLVWPFKDCVLEGGMTKEDEKRKEIFFNEILAHDEIDKLYSPKVLTNWKRYTQKGEQKVKELKRDKDGTIRENLIIKGNNLLALHSLKQEFQGKVKLIYIDPPYNTGNDSFSYNDSFNHSTWLTFMKNRLEVAKFLLRDDGVIFVQIDDIEHAYLKILLDEIFGRENFVSNISWQRAPEGRTVLGQSATFIINSKEEILTYAKNIKKLSKGNESKKRVDSTEKVLKQYNMYFKKEGVRKLVKEIKTKSGNKIKIFKHSNFEIKRIPSSESNSKRVKNFEKLSRIAAQQEESSLQQTILKSIDKDNLYSVEYIPQSGKHKGINKKSYYLGGGIILQLSNYAETDGERIFRLADMNDFWSHDEIQVTGISQEGNVTLRRGKKPERLVQRIIDLSTRKDDIILDFFMGSGTTCSVAHKMGRQYIGIEQLDYGDDDSVVRLNNVIKGEQSGISKAVNWQGGGEFIYCELMKYNEKFIEEIEKAKDTKALLKIWDEMSAKGGSASGGKDQAFFKHNIDLQEFEKNLGEFKKLPLNKQKETLIQLLNKNQLYVNFSEMGDKEFKVGEEDKKLNGEFYK